MSTPTIMQATLLSHAAAVYRKTRVSTASDALLLVEMHDAAIACVLTPNTPGDSSSAALLRAHALIAELQATLQPEHDAALASELSSFYDAILQRIVEAYLQEEPQPLVAVAAALRELRTVWSRLSEQPVGRS